jgi:DNA-binding MarR family transcriptional regulator
MATTSAAPSTRDLLVAVGDVLVAAEPILLRLWKSSRLTLGALRVLRALADEPRSPGELATLTGSAAPTMARLLSRLEERGLVGRSIDPADRRRIEVTLSDAGRAVLNRTHVLKDSAFERAAAELPPAERAELVAGLRRFTERVRE